MFLPTFKCQSNIEMLTGDRAQTGRAMRNPAINLGVNLYVAAALLSLAGLWMILPLLLLAALKADLVCVGLALLSVGIWLGAGLLVTRLRPWLNRKLQPYQVTL